MTKLFFKRVIDILIQLFIVTGFLYDTFELFFVFGNSGGSIVLFNQAKTISIELLVSRRLYAIEFWIVFTCYIVYLGLRERIFHFKEK